MALQLLNQSDLSPCRERLALCINFLRAELAAQMKAAQELDQEIKIQLVKAEFNLEELA